MKHSRLYLLTLTALALGHWSTPSLANDAPAARGLEEIPDAELAVMRGRYTIGDNAVAWFGVQMISTWQNTAGQVLQSSLALDMDFTHGGVQPRVNFQPNVSITRPDAPTPPTVPTIDPSRNVDGSGLTNVGGVAQSVQVAGDSNLASNVTQLTVQDGGSAPTTKSNGNAAGVPSKVASARADGSSAVASFDGKSANVQLAVDGQGMVEQWIRNGSIGQSVQLTADNQWVSNRMQIDLVRQAIATNTQLAQNVAQAINLARGIGVH
jgi:hypothetical protein